MLIHAFFVRKILSEKELQKPQIFKKMLRKSPASNASAEIFKNADFSWRSLKVKPN